MSDETPWTKGPWGSAMHGWRIKIDSDYGPIAVLSFPDKGSDEANARLISAAPAMAELLAKWVSDFEAGHNMDFPHSETAALLTQIKGTKP